MAEFRVNRSILVVSHNLDLGQIVRRIVDSSIDVDYAANETAATGKIEEYRPDVIILGYLGSPEALGAFYSRLREGWISRHASLLVVELDTESGHSRVLSEENLVLGIGEYTFMAGETSPMLSSDNFLVRLKELVYKKLKLRENRLKDAILNPDIFCLTWEQIPGPGAFETRQDEVLENARLAAKGGNVCAITVVDNPGGNPAIATEILCTEIRKIGLEPLVHLAFRDRNRNQIESLLFQLAALDINNLLVLTGDYPSKSGLSGVPKPVFDMDGVTGLKLIKAMNSGLEREILRRKTRLAPTEFFIGSAFSPFKQQEAEVMGQYYKLKKKIAAGADFAITQIGYDARKLDELQMWLKINHADFPVLNSIHVLTYATAKTMYENRVPGCVVTEKLLKQLAKEAESADKGKQARLDRAAKIYAFSKGLGFKGACLGGYNLSYNSVDYVVKKGRELEPNWRDFLPEFDFPQTQGYYYFMKDGDSGLNSTEPAPRLQKAVRPLNYALSRALHVTLFEPKSSLFKPMQNLMGFVHKHKGLEKPFHAFEHGVKVGLYGCQDCGDCALFDVAYLCPMSQCPKGQRNAPCGGSFEGWCEVYPHEKQCVWVRAYQRLKASHREDSIGENIVPPCNWELWQTSSWMNYFLGKDHVSKRNNIEPK